MPAKKSYMQFAARGAAPAADNNHRSSASLEPYEPNGTPDASPAPSPPRGNDGAPHQTTGDGGSSNIPPPPMAPPRRQFFAPSSRHSTASSLYGGGGGGDASVAPPPPPSVPHRRSSAAPPSLVSNPTTTPPPPEGAAGRTSSYGGGGGGGLRREPSLLGRDRGDSASDAGDMMKSIEQPRAAANDPSPSSSAYGGGSGKKSGAGGGLSPRASAAPAPAANSYAAYLPQRRSVSAAAAATAPQPQPQPSASSRPANEVPTPRQIQFEEDKPSSFASAKPTASPSPSKPAKSDAAEDAQPPTYSTAYLADENAIAPDGRPWIEVFQENCTSETARTKGINERSLFYCIRVRNPFRVEEAALVVDEEFLVFRDDTAAAAGGAGSPTEEGTAAAAASAGGGEDQMPLAAKAGMADSTNLAASPMVAAASPAAGAVATAAAPTALPPRAFLLDDDLVRVRDIGSDEDKAQQKYQKLREEWKKSSIESEVTARLTSITSPTLTSASTASASAEDPALVAPRPIPNDFQKIIELIWRLSQRGIDVYPTAMLKPYVPAVDRAEKEAKGAWECPYEREYRIEEEQRRAREAEEKAKKNKKKGSKNDDAKSVADTAISYNTAAVTVPLREGGAKEDILSHASVDIRNVDKSTVAGAGDVGDGGETGVESPLLSSGGGGGGDDNDNPNRLTEDILRKQQAQAQTPAARAKAEKKAAAAAKKKAEEKAKAIKQLKQKYPNLANYEANRLFGMALSEADCFLSPDKDELYIKIHARTDKLIDFAEAHSLPLISHEYSPGGGAAIACSAGLSARYSARVKKFAQTLGMPPDMVLKYGAFHIDTPHKMRLMDRLLREPWAYGGCGLQINEMIGKESVITAFFPLHNQTSLVETGLLEWASFRPLFSLAPLDQDENAIISYFGEEIALYFYWIQEMTYFLRWLAVPGMITGVFSAIDFYKTVASASFALCCVVWGGIWCIYWARKEKEFSVLYCQAEQSAQEGVRDEFVGREETLSIADVYEMRFSHPLSMRLTRDSDGNMKVTNTVDDDRKRKRIRYFISYPVIFFIALLMVGVMIVITWWRFDNVDNEYISFGSSILTSVVSAVFGIVFEKATGILNEMENLRTYNDEAEQNIQKSFLFSFFSSYFSLFIIALYPLKDQTDAVRLTQLESQMIIICLVNPMVQNIKETILPNFNFRWRLETDLAGGSKWRGLIAALKMFDFFSKHKDEKELIRLETEALRAEGQRAERLRQQQKLEATMATNTTTDGVKPTSPTDSTVNKTRRGITFVESSAAAGQKRSHHSNDPNSAKTVAKKSAAVDAVRTGVADDRLLLHRYKMKVETARANARNALAYAATVRKQLEERRALIVKRQAQDATAANKNRFKGNSGTAIATSAKTAQAAASLTALSSSPQEQDYDALYNGLDLDPETAVGGDGFTFSMRTMAAHLSWHEERAELWYESQMEPVEGTAGDYLEITLQFGFMAMCAASFPWAAVAALFYNLLELRLDAIKRVHFSRRPMCRTAVDIGPWRGIFVLITLIAVVTNAFLVFIIGNASGEMDVSTSEAAKWKAFIIMQYIAVFVILSVAGMFGTTPASAEKITAKRNAVASRAFQRASDQATRTRREIEALEKERRREERDRREDKYKRAERRRREAEARRRREEREAREKKEAERKAAIAAAAEDFRLRGISTTGSRATSRQ